MHAKFFLLALRVPSMSPDLNVLSTQRDCSTSVSAYGECVVTLSLAVLCVKCEEEILIKLFINKPIFRDS